MPLPGSRRPQRRSKGRQLLTLDVCRAVLHQAPCIAVDFSALYERPPRLEPQQKAGILKQNLSLHNGEGVVMCARLPSLESCLQTAQV